MQVNVPERFTNPTVNARLKTMEQEQKEKLEKFILPRADSPAVVRTPRYRPTRLLTAVIWLKFKHKFLNEGTVKEACRKFEVREKQLSNILSGSKYKGGADPKDTKGPLARGKKHKSMKSNTAIKEPEQDDDNDNQPPPPRKEHRRTIKGWPN